MKASLSHLWKVSQDQNEGVSGNVPNSLEDLDKLANMLVSSSFFLLPDNWVTWMMDKGSRLVLWGLVCGICNLYLRQLTALVEGRWVRGE